MGSHEKINGYEAHPAQKNAHVIVVGNEKGGSGKTTTAMHLTIALLKWGFQVATVDLDDRQKSLTHYIENRKKWSAKNNVHLELPTYHRFDRSDLDSETAAQSEDFASFVEIVTQVQDSHDFIVIDTPGSNNYLMRLAHSMADTLVTPMNDSFVDFDVLGEVDTQNQDVRNVSHYAVMVREARRKRRKIDNGLLDWVVVRNRVAPLASRNQQALLASVKELSLRLGYRVADGIGDRVIFREYFTKGLTALDAVDSMELDARPSKSHASAKQEVLNLIQALRLPIDDPGRERAKARESWLTKPQIPAETAEHMQEATAE